MTTPRAVLEAGRLERKRYRYHRISIRVGETGDCEVTTEGKRDRIIRCFKGTENACQDFIEDRVFRAMLRAWSVQPSVTDRRTELSEEWYEFFPQALLALAGDDHG